ncbi:flagellar biosynthesis regulator FlaF [Pseudooctadecabacter jejudonensis]|uniref:Flagellar biosynthesis regulatory protein FlaF n=1 Tax=Pseudooctadecabacter jejudonensis TaxID=1391910 RepID=A0A1Y5S3C8_9RHOB|nr:flagellar biosynthesis regulator FlaF [Pseudooctadecabacter jejudonensis]SLN31765.1 flagellar biosynthesis regulatory protein FlaF [Pseudooctadecabacter jejudonensis]
MNIIDQARQAYAPKTTVLRTGRSIEHQLFSDVTVRLKEANAKKKTDFATFAEAVHANRAVWTHLASQVAEDENALSTDLRARIFYLAEFTAFHSAKILQNSADIAPLIEINTAMMRGLSARDDT